MNSTLPNSEGWKRKNPRSSHRFDPRIFNQSWWCGYGSADRPTLVVCALIENGGHGGTAAAPAALHVFESFFHVKAATTGPVHSD